MAKNGPKGRTWPILFKICFMHVIIVTNENYTRICVIVGSSAHTKRTTIQDCIDLQANLKRHHRLPVAVTG